MKLNGYQIVEQVLHELSPTILKNASEKAKVLYNKTRDPFIAMKAERQIQKFKRAAQKRALAQRYVDAIHGKESKPTEDWMFDR